MISMATQKAPENKRTEDATARAEGFFIIYIIVNTRINRKRSINKGRTNPENHVPPEFFSIYKRKHVKHRKSNKIDITGAIFFVNDVIINGITKTTKVRISAPMTYPAQVIFPFIVILQAPHISKGIAKKHEISSMILFLLTFCADIIFAVG